MANNDPNPGTTCDVPRRRKSPGKVTLRDVTRYHDFYLAGPGRDAAYQSDCPHGYRLTDSCPNCP